LNMFAYPTPNRPKTTPWLGRALNFYTAQAAVGPGLVFWVHSTTAREVQQERDTSRPAGLE
jgi:hypothetical protein